MTEGTSANSSPYSAAPSATGYLFQCRYALLAALQRMRNEEDFQVYIETLDDVVFEQDGQAPEILQTKHHVNKAADLTDASVDLWKTLRIWCEGVANDTLNIESRFILVTTSNAGNGSAAAMLKYDDSRNIPEALNRLRSTAVSSVNQINVAAYTAFQSLTFEKQIKLFENIWLVDAVPTITFLDKDIRQAVFYAVESHFLDSFLIRLEGWWLRRIIRHLSIERHLPILSTELLDEINNLRDQLRDDNLPIDDSIEQMKVDATGYQNRIFVQQLRLINIGNERIVRAIRDYYRAFIQRSQWVREELVGVGDLERYETRLKDAWESRFLIMQDELSEIAADEEKRRLANELYKWVETGELPRIRPRCQDGFVARGSYHIMSDHLKIGWHIEFEARLRDLLEPATEGASR